MREGNVRVWAAVAAIVAMWLLSGCVSEETRQLAQGIHLYQVRQSERVTMLADFAREKGALAGEDRDRVVEDQRALVDSTKALLEILGEPRTPVEVVP